MVETNLGSHQESNIIPPICLTSRPETHVHSLLMHEKSSTAIFSMCFDIFPAILNFQLIFSSKIKEKDSTVSDFIQFNKCEIDCSIISMDYKIFKTTGHVMSGRSYLNDAYTK